MNIGRHAPIRAAVSPKPLSCYASSSRTLISFLRRHQSGSPTQISSRSLGSVKFFRHAKTQATNIDDPSSPQPLRLAISIQHGSGTIRGLSRPFSSTTYSRNLEADEVELDTTELKGDEFLSDVDEEQISVDDPHNEEWGLSERSQTNVLEIGRIRPCTRIAHTSDGSVWLELLLREEAPEGVLPQPLESRTSDIPIASEPCNRNRVMKSALADEVHRWEKARVERALRREGPSWLQLLRVLDRRTPPIAERLEVTALRGTKSALDDIYEHLMNTGGHGIIPEEPYTRFGHGYIRLAGQSSAIDAIRVQLDEIQGSTQGLVRSIRTGTKLEVAVYEKRARRPLPQKVLRLTEPRVAREIPFPEVWMKENLQEYITSLLKSRKPASLSMDQDNQKHVIGLMFQVLFKHNASRACLSWPTLHDCLSYLVKHRRSNLAREFMWEMGSAGFDPTTETYNIMLYGCALEQNMASFGHYLSLMQDRELIPNDRTWLSLLQAAPTIQAQQTIARAMQRKGLHLQSAISRDDTASFVPFSLGPFLDAGGDGLQYLGIIDKLLGQKWLNEQAAGRLLEVLCLRGRMMDCVKIISILLERRAAMLRKDALHKMLRYCSKHKKLDFAIWLIVHADTEWNQPPTDHVTLQLMFEIAISSRACNLARVAWKYAAMSGELAHNMRVTVHDSLKFRLESVPETRDDRWRASIGVIICGRDPSSGPMFGPDNILQEERDLFKASKPYYHLTTMVVEAWLLDREWSSKGLMKTATPEWLLANSISVPLRPVETPTTHPPFNRLHTAAARC